VKENILMSRLFIFLFIIFFLSSFAFGGDYIIGEGDVLDISVWGVSELSLTATVRPDGKITIPALGEIAVAGFTPKELQALLTERMKTLVKDPTITVIVAEINNNKVFVFGGGVEPGVYTLNQRTTLSQLLTQVSGIRNADLERAYLLRNNKKIKEGFYKLFITGDLSEDILLEPKDVIFTPALVEKNVYVVGAVTTPTIIEYREGLTVMEAILTAGGFTKFAKQNNTVIYRRRDDKELKITVKMKNLIQKGDMSQNIMLKPGDYIVAKEGVF